jgi:hypothetical protein
VTTTRKFLVAFVPVALAIAGLAFFLLPLPPPIVVEISPGHDGDTACHIAPLASPFTATTKDPLMHVWVLETIVFKADERSYQIVFTGENPLLGWNPKPVAAGTTASYYLSLDPRFTCRNNTTSANASTCQFPFTVTDTNPDSTHSTAPCDPTIHVTK